MLARRGFLSAFVAAASLARGFAPRTADADTVTAPTGPILEITGKIAHSPQSFDLAALKAIGDASFKTGTPWDAGKSVFEGVPMDALMQKVVCTGQHVRAYGLDDYFVELPVSDFHQYGVLLAYKRDGSYLNVVDRGPLWIVYPFDSRPILNNNLYYGRSVWQLQRLDIS
ncbi:putative pterin-binding protein [Acidisoma sp. 7E03]